MDNMNNGQNHPQGCMCGMCKGNKMGLCGACGGHHMGFHILRWVLGILILVMIFSFGVKVGEFASELQSGYGYHHSMMRYAPVMMYQTTPAGTAVTTGTAK